MKTFLSNLFEMTAPVLFVLVVIAGVVGFVLVSIH